MCVCECICVCDDSALSWQLQWSINLLEQLSCHRQSWGESSHQKTITQSPHGGQRPPKGSSPFLWVEIGWRHRLEEELFIRHTHASISPSCWFSSLVALQSINQQTRASFPKHPSIHPSLLLALWWGAVCVFSLLQLNAPPIPRLFQGDSIPRAQRLPRGTAGGSPWSLNVTSPRKTSRLCLPLRDELNGEEQSFGKRSRDTPSCSPSRRNCTNPLPC